ncbi:MAG: trypsin-like peptidase domain-containing protein [Candidatus Sungbacteria bacterium]|nr:trypsin-like peptidase domain-containing protein [Candidatus Sungbacteria bacterium]
MEKFGRSQFLALIGVVAFLAASAGTVLTQSYLDAQSSRATPFDFLRQGIGATVQKVQDSIGGNLAANEEDAIVEAVEVASPAVVSIVASKDVPIIERRFVNPFENDPFFRQFFGNDFLIPQFEERGSERRQVSSGTGFIVSSDGLIVTNKHVVADAAAEYTVLMNNGLKIAARVLARDPLEDLAIVKVDRTGLPTVKLGDSSKIKIGQTAIAIGNSLGEFRNTVSVGVVSGLQRSIIAAGGGTTEQLSELIQTDAAINPGNSGGPLLNSRGEVIGINTAIVQGASNIGFSIPINKAKRDIESVKKTGRIILPYIGVRYATLNAEIQKENNLPVSEGAWLKSSNNERAVMPGSPAEKADLREGDIVVEVNGQNIDAEHSLVLLIQQYAVGDTVTLAYFRDGERKTTSLRLAERP